MVVERALKRLRSPGSGTAEWREYISHRSSKVQELTLKIEGLAKALQENDLHCGRIKKVEVYRAPIRVRSSETRAGYRNRQFAVDTLSQPCHIHILRLLCLELTMVGPSGLCEVR